MKIDLGIRRLFVWLLLGASASTMLLAVGACSTSVESTPTPVVATSPPATSPPPTSTPQVVATEMPEATPPTSEPISVVTSTSILADWVDVVGGDRVDVFNVVPRQSDPHTHQPGGRDVARVADADVILSVGLELEGSWLVELLENAKADESDIIELGEGIDAIPFSEDAHEDEDGHGDEDEHAHDEDEDGHGDEDAHDEDDDEDGHGDEDAHDEDEDAHGDEDEHAHEDEDAHDEDEDGHGDEDAHDEDEDGHGDEDAHDEDEDGHGDEDAHDEDEDAHGDEDEHAHEDEHGHAHGDLDPHFWFDPIRVKEAVNLIAQKLSEIEPSSADYFAANAAAYSKQLDDLDAWIMERVGTVAESNRLLVTSHDAFGYFANRYGFKVVGVVIPGGGTEIEPSASDLAELVHEIEEAGVNVVFTEVQISDALAVAVSDEAGARVVGGLHTGSLGPEGMDSGTYLGMMRYDVDIIVNALSASQ